MTDGIPRECELCRSHGYSGAAVNPPDRWIDVRTGDGGTRRLYCCGRCARETTFRGFSRIGTEEGDS